MMSPAEANAKAVAYIQPQLNIDLDLLENRFPDIGSLDRNTNNVGLNPASLAALVNLPTRNGSATGI